jgi:hypothetical protein
MANPVISLRFSRQFRHYLLGRHFTVRTDHNSLTWLMNFKEPQGQLARWLKEQFGVYSLLFFHFVFTWALKTDALCLPNYLDSLDTFPSKSMSDKQGSFCLGKRGPVERRG